MTVTTPIAHNLALALAVESIEEVAKQSDLRGDEIQAAWCRSLNQKLGGGD
jgi:hypothetical protein